MSWSRNWLPRFASPFTSRPSSASSPTAAHPISETDYNYISPEDLDFDPHSHSGKARQVSDAHMHMHRGHKESDAVLLRHKRVTYPVHFPPFSIDDGVLTVGDVRREAAHVLERETRRVKLLYKGKNLTDDARRCIDVGLSSYGQPEILCLAGEGAANDTENAAATSDASDISGDEDDDEQDGAPATDKKRRKNRNRKARRRNKGGAPDSPSLASPSHSHASVPKSGNVEHLPIPSGHSLPAHRAQSGSRQPSPATSRPTTPAGKLDLLRQKLSSELAPLAEAYIKSPPAEKDKRDSEYKKLTETILTQVLLKTDEVETDDPEIRARRKELVNECNRWLQKLDEAKDKK